MAAEISRGITEGLGMPSQESLDAVRAEWAQRQQARQALQALDLPARIVDRTRELGITRSSGHYYLRPERDKGLHPQLYTQPIFLPDFSYRSLRRWTLVYNLRSNNVFERGVQDWVTGQDDQTEGAWPIRSHITARRTEDTAPLVDQTMLRRIQFSFGRRYEQEMPSFFGMLIDNESSDVGAFMDATRPFVGGEVIELHPGQGEIARVPHE